MIVEGILNECNEKEKELIELNEKLFIKIYKLGITFGYNNK